jgi:SprB repeat/Secretion system C-terminal sorting domain
MRKFLSSSRFSLSKCGSSLLSFLLSLFFSASFLTVQAQQVSPLEVVQGVLVKKTEPLINLKPDPRFINEVVRDNEGLIKARGVKKPVETSEVASGLPNGPDMVRQVSTNEIPNAAGGTTIIGPNFDGMPYTFVAPADPTMCVGPNHVIQMINGSSGSYFKVFDRAGNVLKPDTYIDNLAGNTFSGNGDPLAIYDQLANRFVLVEFATIGSSNLPNTLVFCVSQTPDPLGAWYIYTYTNVSLMPDYEKVAVWSNAYYATSNDFAIPNGNYVGSSVFAFDRNAMLAGNPVAEMQRFRLTDGSNRYFSMTPVTLSGTDLPPAGAPGLFLYLNDDSRTFDADVDSVGMLAMNVVFGAAASTTVTTLPGIVTSPFKSTVCAAGRGRCIPTLPAGTQLEALHQRLMWRATYRKFGDHEAIVCAQTVDAGASLAGIRWHELRKTSANWGLQQEGTYAPDNTLHRFMPSISINKSGQIAMTYNVSSSAKSPSIFVVGRNATDPAGTMTYPETQIFAGTGVGNFNSGRWGDYNDINVDPVNDNTFWGTAMYGAANWRTRVYSFDLKSACATVISLTGKTDVACNGANTGAIDITVTGGTAPYTFAWSNGATTEDLANIPAGVYSVVVTDAASCTANLSVTINQATTALNASASVTSNYNGAQISCFGASDGAIAVTATGGTPPYSFTVGTVTNTTGIFTGLPTGSVTYAVKDSSGCTETGTITLMQPSAITGSVSVSPNPVIAGYELNTIYLGYGPQSVMLTASGNGGTGTLNYSWGALGSTATISVSPKITTTYTATIKDANGCTTLVSVVINVIDVRCGNKMDKVKVCHKPGTCAEKTLCISANGVPDHLAHGDRLGDCVLPDITHIVVLGNTSGSIKTMVKIFPNPADAFLQFVWTGNDMPADLKINITDVVGRTMLTRKATTQTIQRIDISDMPKGVYVVQLISAGKIIALGKFAVAR